MSSHHIVRDNQEPALLILSADQVPFEIVQELLEWSPFIIVHESQLDIVLHWGIKIDMILFEDINKAAIIDKATLQFPLKLLSHRTGENPLDTILYFLRAGNYPSVNILTNDTTIFSYLTAFASSIDIVVVQNNIRWLFVRSGHFEKRMADEATLYIRDNESELTPVFNDDFKVNIKKDKPFWIGEKL